MTLEEYMKIKFPKKNIKNLSKTEAEILNITLDKGWFTANKHMEITDEMLNELLRKSLKSGGSQRKFRQVMYEYKSLDGQFIYLMRNEIGRLKIGISKEPIQRARHLTTSSGLLVEVVNYWIVDKPADLIEKELLSYFKTYSTYGEWFKCDGEINTESIEEVMTGLCNFNRIV